MNLEIFNAPKDVSFHHKQEAAILPAKRKRKEVKLEQVSVKLHPDIIKVIGELVAKERKMPAEVMRDLVLKGLRAEGMDL